MSRIWEFWDEYGKTRERIGELIQRVGMPAFLDGIGLEPAPEMVSAPRDNPFIFFQTDQGGENNDYHTTTTKDLPTSDRRLMTSSCPRW